MKLRISFCVTCRNRWYQLRDTLGHNLNLLGDHEIVLVNYGSEDALDSEIRQFDHEISRGKLKYFHTTDPVSYDSSKAKNLAHRLASHEFLFNLDGDNYLSAEFILELETLFSRHPYAVVHAFDGDRYVAGTYGRIGMHRDNFYAVGGYNEGFLPMGFQDDDLILRLNTMGLPYMFTRSATLAPIFNSIAQKGDETGNGGGAVAYDEFRERNILMSFSRLKLLGPVLEKNFATFRGRVNHGDTMVVDGFVAPVRPLLPPHPELFLGTEYQARISRYYRYVQLRRNRPIQRWLRNLLGEYLL